MDSTLNLDVYCERAGDPALFAEPLNALTNIAFLIAAILAWRAFHKQTLVISRGDSGIVGLIAMLALISLGSGFWHVHPLKAALLADVLPIYCFINIYLVTAMRELFRFSWRRTGAGWVFFTAASALINTYLPQDALNGSIMYAPAVGALLLIALIAEIKKLPGARRISAAFAIISCSVVLRTFDKSWCASFPLGTHFLWHLLNALVLWLLISALLKARAARA